jgi:hypothetical protein
VVDDTKVPHPSWHECDTANDTSADVGVACEVGERAPAR